MIPINMPNDAAGNHTCGDTKSLRLVGLENPEAKPTSKTLLRPELRKAADASWKRNEAAFRYLGQ